MKTRTTTTMKEMKEKKEKKKGKRQVYKSKKLSNEVFFPGIDDPILFELEDDLDLIDKGKYSSKT